MPARPLILGIETSCDDTACAVLDGDGRVLASVVSSQLDVHRPFGGVVPEYASREHLANWPDVSAEALRRAGISFEDLDAVSATRGPGLVGSLLVGLSLGRALALARGIPFHGVHHLEGHLYSPFLHTQGEAAEEVPDEFIGLILSGGHSSLLKVDPSGVTSLVETRDDAMGEVFDKVGKRLGLAYPQGPRLDELAELGDADQRPLTMPKIKNRELFFSYSGLKSQALREIEALERAEILNVDSGADDGASLPQEAFDLAAGFRRAAVDQVLHRLDHLYRRERFRVLAVSGGAAANRLLRRELPAWAAKKNVDLRLVPLAFSSDNAAMIAWAALQHQRRGLSDDPRDVVVAARIPFRQSA